MPESVPVRCPACRREHVYTAPVYPCVCGAPVAPRPDPAAEPLVAAHRAWDDEWLTLPCAACGRRGQWPHPELGCPCGTVLRIQVIAATGGPAQAPGAADANARPPAGTPVQAGTPEPPQAPAGAEAEAQAAVPGVPDRRADAEAEAEAQAVVPGVPDRRAAFAPHPIRTARDAVTAAALYLRRLGYQDIRRADQRPPSGVGLAARGLLAQVDPTVRPASPRDVECLWLTAMTESADCVYFSLAGYSDDARAGAAALGVALFVLDLTGVPRPVNDAAGTLDAEGAPHPRTRTRDGRT
ncbi:hypothetical protein [Streptomyces sp. NPDC096012]|uniref:hypothetical protein n=1 Tax=Streptomyces sp. NPDC096012 TaxID=3155684 RepID=UPI00336A74F4